MALKHNKKKNGRIIYEQLMILATRLARTKHIKESSYILNFVKKHYGPSTMLGKEKKLFDAVLETKTSDRDEVDSILNEVLTEVKTLDNRALEWEKVDLINKVVNNFGKDLFSIPIKEYKLLASTQILFNEMRNEFKYSNPTERAKIKKLLTERMNTEVEKPEDYEMDNFTFNILVNKFNQKYSPLMNEDQKEILSNWIDYLITEDSKTFLNYLKEKTDMARSLIDYALIKESHHKSDYLSMLKEARDKLRTCPKSIDEESVHEVMRYYDLIEELKEIENNG